MTSEAVHGAAVPELGEVSVARRVLPPLVLAAGAIATVGVAQLVFDPFRQDVPLCPVHAMTGLICPGCGMTRAVHALVSGDVLLALRSNAMVLVLLPVVAVAWWRWFRARLRGAARPMPPDPVPRAEVVQGGAPRGGVPQDLGRRGRMLVLLFVAVTAVYTVARNLPALAVLAPPSFIGA